MLRDALPGDRDRDPGDRDQGEPVPLGDVLVDEDELGLNLPVLDRCAMVSLFQSLDRSCFSPPRRLPLPRPEIPPRD